MINPTESVSNPRYVLYSRDTTLSSSLSAKENPHALQSDPDMLFKNTEILKHIQDTQPALRNPVSQSNERLSSQATLVLLMAKVSEAAAHANNAETISNLNALIKRMTAQKEYLNQVSDAFDSAVKALSDATDKFGEASRIHDAARQEFDAAKRQFDAINERFSHLLPSDPEYASVQNQLILAKLEMNQKQAVLSSAERALNAALIECDKAAVKADAAFQSVNDAVQKFPALLPSVRRDTKGSLARFIELIVTMLKTINDSNAEAIQSQSKVMKALNEAKMKQLMEKSEEIEEKQRAAEKSRKFWCTFSAVFGALLAVVGIIAAVPTGGVSAAAAVGLGVAVVNGAMVGVDIVLQLTNQFSPMNWLFEKVNTLVKPVVDHIFSQFIAQIAAFCGANDASVDKVREYCTFITSTIVTSVIMMLPMLASSAAASVAASRASAAASAAANSAAEAAARTATRVVEESLAVVSKSLTVVQKVRYVADIIKFIAMAANGVISMYFSVSTGINAKKMMDAISDYKMTDADRIICKEIISQMAGDSRSVSETVTSAIQVLSEVLHSRTHTLQAALVDTSRLGKV